MERDTVKRVILAVGVLTATKLCLVPWVESLWFPEPISPTSLITSTPTPDPYPLHWTIEGTATPFPAGYGPVEWVTLTPTVTPTVTLP